jgi:hypothetical protein
LECGDSAPLSIAAEPLSFVLSQKESRFTTSQSGDESP